MKVFNVTTGVEIECSEEHFMQVLSRQGWREVVEEKKVEKPKVRASVNKLRKGKV